MKDLSIIIPVLNEEKNIQELVQRIIDSFKDKRVTYEILFVDDHSTDSSLSILKKLSQKNSKIKVYSKKGKIGKAYSLYEGIQYSNSKYIAMIDADLQYPPENLPKLYELAKKNGVAVGERKYKDTSLFRKVVSYINKTLTGKFILGYDGDVQSGIKVFKSEPAKLLKESDIKPWTFDMQLLNIAHELGLNTVFSEIVFEKRRNGQSKINFINASIEIFSEALKLRLRRKRVYEIEDEKHSKKITDYIYNKNRFTTYANLSHKQSAFVTFTLSQKIALLTVFILLLTGLYFNFYLTVTFLVAFLSIIYFLDMLFSSFVLTKSLGDNPQLKISKKEIKSLKPKDLPVYTILCPLYKEANVLPDFVESIKKLDWPKNKLQVLLLLEEDDKETISKAETLNLPRYFEVVIVPDSQPKTKPKACNYGLLKAKGDFVVIYDAEDKPDPLQLKKAFIGFNKSSQDVVCLQSKLNYYNSDFNFLTKLFTAEYSTWFDLILPGLQSISTIIPLGGTSNHFRKDELLKLGGWDAFNVTEDCDLGVRLFIDGKKTAIIDSTTLEEANSHTRNWIRQRSRWIKGYLQTYLVHMRNPLNLWRIEKRHFLIFHLIIGMRIVFILINPLLWVLTASYFLLYEYVGAAIESIYPAPVFYIASITLVFGNFLNIYNYMIGLAIRKKWSLIKYVYLIPLYWLLSAMAAVIAFYQLIFKPHYWEKTLHGIGVEKQKEAQTADQEEYVTTPKAGIVLPKLPKWNFTFPLYLVLSAGVGMIFGVIASQREKILESIFIILRFTPLNYLAIVMFFAALFFTFYFHYQKQYKQAIIGYMFVLYVFIGSNFFRMAQRRGDEAFLYSSFFLLSLLVLYFIDRRRLAFKNNWYSLTDLFRKNGKSNGKDELNILVYNWRDTRHAWAGGAEVYVQELAKRWVKKGCKVTLFCGNDGQNPRNEYIDGVKIIRRGGFFTVYFWAFVYYIFKFRGKYDVIVESENGTPFFTPVYARIPKILIVHHINQKLFTNHLPFPLSQLAKLIESRLMPLVYRNHTTVTVSSSSKNDFIGLGFVKAKNVHIVSPALGEESFRKARKLNNPAFIYVGRLQHYKNIDVAIKSFSKVVKKYPKATLKIAGDGESYKDLQKLINELGLEESVKLLGRVSENTKKFELARSWVALQPSSFEGWGITVIEANACATPVIASDVNGLKDSVIDGKTGILAESKNVDAFANAMIAIIKNRELRERLSQNAYSWAKTFNWDNNADKFLDIIESELSEKHLDSITDQVTLAKRELFSN